MGTESASPPHTSGPAGWLRSSCTDTEDSTPRPTLKVYAPSPPLEVCGQQKQSNNPRNNQHNPQYAIYWAPLTRKRHIPPHSAQPRHTNHWAPRTRKRHQQEHRPQRPTQRSDPTQHAKGRAGDCPGPRKGTTTGRNVTQGAWRGCWARPPCPFRGDRARKVHLAWPARAGAKLGMIRAVGG